MTFLTSTKTALPFPLQEEVDAAVTVNNLGVDVITRKFGDDAGAQSFFDHAIGAQGVGIDPDAVDFNEFEGPGEFAQRVGGSGDEDAVAGDGALEHAAGIGSMGGDDAAVIEFDLGEKTLIAAQETAGKEGRRQLHAQISAISRSEMPRRYRIESRRCWLM